MLRTVAIWLVLVGCGGVARPLPRRTSFTDAIPMNAQFWELSARDAAFVQHLGRPSIRLRGGLAYLRGVILEDGVIDFDIAADAGVAFSGLAWHLQDAGTFEKFYLRTFLSGSREACQYAPVFNHIAGWQIYHGPNFNHPLRFRRDRWTHIRVVTHGRRADIYVGDMNEPVLHVDPLRLNTVTGRVALYNEPVPEAMQPVATYFSNVRVRPAAPAELRGSLREPVEAPRGRVPKYWVSKPFDSAALADTAPTAAGMGWRELDGEPSGLADLARLSGVEPGADTVFARVRVKSDTARRARLRFGFSERIQVYVDGRRVFATDATWHSHDISFQGVIGWHDELTIDIASGVTELWFAVSENLEMRGGWGIQAAFLDAEGLSFVDPPPSEL